MDQVRETVSQALEHRHIPIERLLGMVKGEHGHPNSPSISVNFIFQKTFIQNAVYTDFALIDMPSLPAGAIYDLNFFMVERPDGWRFSCQYNTDQFEGATALRLLDYYENVLESAVANADQRLSELTLGGLDEARRLLAELNDTRALYPRDLTLAKLFETHASRSPGSIAVVCADRQLSYGELNTAANRVAGYLRTQGIGPGARVGISLQASVELPICLLAVLKTGAAYVPIDPATPPLRRARLVAASQAMAIIGRHWQRSAAVGRGVKLLDIEVALVCGVATADSVPMPSGGSESTACLVFAAESSEAARLAGLSHRNLANLIYAVAKRTELGDRDRVVATSPFSLDRASFEILLPLLTGTGLVLASDQDLVDGRALKLLLQRTGATLMYGGSAIWSRLLEAGWSGNPALKMFVPATDMNVRLMERLAALRGECWSLYGVAEAGIWSAIHRIHSKPDRRIAGAPFANTSLQVLDSALQIAPVGVTGELFIGGDGLAEVARPGAQCSVAGTRLLRTGDSARLRSDGQIEILGRNDGFFRHLDRLIDPAEIERALERHPDVAEALVRRTAIASGEDSLVAYLVMRGRPAGPDGSVTLEEHLQDWLPQYLRPASLVVVESLPRTPDGELDRSARPTPEGRTNSGAPRPSGEIEERLAEIWASMLRVARVDATANFFELGGHSLLAARMLTQVERAFGRRINLATLFFAPTLREFAAIVAQGDLREFDFRQVVKIQPHGSKRPLIAINNTGVYYGLARCLGPEQPVYSLQLFDPSTRGADMPQTLEEIAAGYVDLIRRVQPEGPYDLMGWCVAGALAFEIARQLALDNREVAHLFLIDSWVPGYFTRLPKLRALIGEYSLRLQLILADWRQVVSREKSLREFLAERKTIAKWRRVMFGAEPSGDQTFDEDEALRNYDQWLLAYLQKVTAGYTPRPYHGRVILVRSSLEPTGWLFHPDAGWAPFTPNGIEVQFVEGNHFTMFQQPGANQMAAHLANAIRS
jgi:non-ribosomal peptide synthetase component F/thioesterase domain-containing protein/acyl carrier protein